MARRIDQSRRNIGWKGWTPASCGLMLATLFLFALSGCSAMKQQADTNATLEKQIERQQMYQMAAEPEPVEKLTAEQYEDRGDSYLQSGNVERAFISYVRGLAIEPQNTSLLQKEGVLLLSRKKYGEAEEIFRRLLDLRADDAAALEGLGRALLGQKQTEAAEDCFLKAVAKDPSLWRSCNGLALIDSSRGKHDQALKWIGKAIEIQPREASLLNNQAVTYYLMGKYTEAETCLNKAAAINPADPRLYNNLALVSLELGNYDQALEAFKKGSSSEAVAYNNIGRAFLASKQYEEAIVAFERAIALKPKFYPSANQNLEQARQELAGLPAQ